MKKPCPRHSKFSRPSNLQFNDPDFLDQISWGAVSRIPFVFSSFHFASLCLLWLQFSLKSTRTNIYTASTSPSRCFSFPTLLRIYTSIPNSGDQEFRTNGRVWINIGATAAGPSTHSFLQRQWCFSFSSHQKRGPGHGTWATQQNTRSQWFSATIDKRCTPNIEPCSTDVTNFLISCGGIRIRP
jgi:hypothetical protein